MVWEEEFSYTGVLQEVKTTLGGVPKVFSAPIKGPKNITLRGLQDQGWQTYATLKALQSIAQVQDGQFTLLLGSQSFTVAFRHHEPPVIEATPLTPRTQYDDTDYFVVSLKLVSYTNF
jgi:hypothetical protein